LTKPKWKVGDRMVFGHVYVNSLCAFDWPCDGRRKLTNTGAWPVRIDGAPFDYDYLRDNRPEVDQLKYRFRQVLEMRVYRLVDIFGHTRSRLWEEVTE